MPITKETVRYGWQLWIVSGFYTSVKASWIMCENQKVWTSRFIAYTSYKWHFRRQNRCFSYHTRSRRKYRRSIKMLKRPFFRDSLCREKKWCLREYHCYRLLPRVHVYTVLLWQCECNWATSIFCRICLLRSLKSTAETTNWRTVATLARSFNFCYCLAIRHDYLFKK